jgi:uncharacterized protein (DUF2164 family)
MNRGRCGRSGCGPVESLRRYLPAENETNHQEAESEQLVDVLVATQFGYFPYENQKRCHLSSVPQRCASVSQYSFCTGIQLNAAIDFNGLKTINNLFYFFWNHTYDVRLCSRVHRVC